MAAEVILMSGKEQARPEVLRLYVEGHIEQKEAARRLGLSTRQVRNLVRAYRRHGAAELVSRRRSRRPNNKIADALRRLHPRLVRGPSTQVMLIVFIDNATSELPTLRFAPAETTQAHLETFHGHLRQHGRPVAF